MRESWDSKCDAGYGAENGGKLGNGGVGRVLQAALLIYDKWPETGRGAARGRRHFRPDNGMNARTTHYEIAFGFSPLRKHRRLNTLVTHEPPRPFLASLIHHFVTPLSPLEQLLSSIKKKPVAERNDCKWFKNDPRT